MRFKYITAACLGVLLMYAPTQMKAASVDNSVYEQYENAVGLIEKCSLRCFSDESGYIEFTAKTQVSGKMKEVGFKNIVVQYSSDGENWYDEYTIGDHTGTDTKYHNINGYRAKVKGGYFYRISCVHYAKGSTYDDPDERTQTAVNASSGVWVNKAPVVTTTTTTTTRPVTTTTTFTTKRVTSTSKLTTKTTSKVKTKTTSTLKTAVTDIAGTKAKGNNSFSRKTASAAKKTGTAAAAAKTTASTTAAVTSSASNSPKTGDRPPVLEFTALCSAGAAAIFLRSKNSRRS